jgi:hypothetical protein
VNLLYIKNVKCPRAIYMHRLIYFLFSIRDPQVDTRPHWITISSQSHAARRLFIIVTYLASSLKHCEVIFSLCCHLCSDQLMKSFAMEFPMPGPLEFTDQATHSFNSCLNLMVLWLIFIYIFKVNLWFLSKYFEQETWRRWHSKHWCNCIL